MDKIKEAFSRLDKFSLENANRLCTEVERIEETLLSSSGDAERKSKLIDASLQHMRELTEVLVWMDGNHHEWFERVLERDVMNTLERLVTNGLMPSSVKQQSLQSVTVMLQNLSRTSSLYYLCSNNHINRMVAVEFDIHDDEFVSLYVSFLKSLALRCTPDTVQLFFEAQDKAFPLWDRAVRLLGSEDVMVRTAAKQIIITIAQLQDTAVSAFIGASIADVFRSVLHFVNAQIVRLAAHVPSWISLQGMGSFARASSDPSVAVFSFSSDAAATAPPPAARAPRVVNTRVLTMQLEDLEDELLYINDLCRTPVSNAGTQAAAVTQRVLFPRFRGTIEDEVNSAGIAFDSSVASVTCAKYPALSVQPSGSYAPACVVLAFLFYWSQVNTDACVAAALVDFFLKPLHSSSGTSRFTVVSMVLESTRVDLHEPVVAVCRHALSRTRPQPTSSASPSPPLRFPSSLGQFFYIETPYQKTGMVLIGGPGSTIPPPKEKLVQKVWPSLRTDTPTAFVSLIPHLVAALYTQVKYFQATRLSCVTASLSLLLDVIPSAAPGKADWANVYLEMMKLVQRLLLDCAKQYASVIQKIVQEQKDADSVVPLSRISFRDIEPVEEEAPLPIQDPYAPMFLKLKEAAMWMETAEQARLPLPETAVKHNSKKDLYLFFPAFPLLLTDECSLILSAWPPLLSRSYQQPREAAQWTIAYHALQDSIARAFDYSTRSPVSDAECELNLYLIFLLMRRAFVCRTQGNGADLLQTTLRQLSPQHTQSMHFTLSNATTELSIRCEITSEWHSDSQAPLIAPPGTPVCMVLPSVTAGKEGRELLFLEIPISVPERVRSQELLTGEYKRRVLCSLDLAFVGIAIHPLYPFKVVLSYQFPGHLMQLHLVTAGAVMARMMVTDVEKAANECRQRGASFCFGIMNYRSALVDE
ncbi:conserved hypothetical protein [Leishmania mexicana MHOM/GT/2001/U1103]|uniref:FPL domain-containing protein n=1 Tax=Leishmania mexicana (strain MHOM/GT/2001/U1103) TaxID=929439 RepID=E9B6Y3_LEIMU|nr:conserved hypothetical protein [Leishmania mexicana MHOM/GT/2001/U1103]CBZ31006.1 conserved hypothetical protein [Leishmania mexicana MHOM/GT/2001/U1103]